MTVSKLKESLEELCAQGFDDYEVIVNHEERESGGAVQEVYMGENLREVNLF